MCLCLVTGGGCGYAGLGAVLGWRVCVCVCVSKYVCVRVRMYVGVCDVMRCSVVWQSQRMCGERKRISLCVAGFSISCKKRHVAPRDGFQEREKVAFRDSK